MTSKAPVRTSRRRQPRHAITAISASSSRVNLITKRTDKLGRERQGWQTEAWVYFDEVPEVKYTVRHIGAAMSKLRLFVAWDDPADDRLPVSLFGDDGVLLDTAAGLTDMIAVSATAELARLDQHTDGGVPALLESMNHQFEIVGECWFVGYAETAETDERWEIRSIDEVEQRNGKVYVRDSLSQKQSDQRMLDPDSDTIMRLWVHHPRFRLMADSPMRSALSDCRALIGLSNEIIAETNSQASAGALLVPNEIDDGTVDFTDEEGDDEDPFVTELENALVEPIIDPESPRAIAPIVIRGPAEYLDSLRHLSFGRDRGRELDSRIEARVTRLARAMNMPSEVVTGLADTTFNNVSQIDQDKWDDHYEPRARLISAMLTSVYLRPNLLDAGFDPEVVNRIVVWGDGSALIRQPNVEQNAGEAHKSMVISDASYRRSVGFGDDDAPDDEELLRRMSTTKAAMTGDSTLALLQLLIADKIGLDLTPTVPSELAPATEPVTVAASVPVTAAASQETDVGRRLMEIDRDLRARLVVAADMHMTRALDRAGSKLRTSKQVRGIVASQVPAREVAATLGMTGMADAGFNPEDLLAGAFDGLEAQWSQWADDAANAALDVVEEMVGAIEDRLDVITGYGEGITAGWTDLSESLRRLAANKLVNPAVIETVGEADLSMTVPDGIVRRAISVAGGPVETASDGGAWVSLTPDGRPAGGIGTGDRTLGVLRNAGATVEGYVWVYGPAARQQPFEPHLTLDGVQFVNFDDPKLSNTSGWPSTAFYIPGDHAGCKCDFSPTIIQNTRRPVAASAAGNIHSEESAEC